MSFRTFGVAGMAMLSVVYAMGGLCVADEKPHDLTMEKQLKQLLQERFEAAEVAFQATTAAYEAETVTLAELSNSRMKLYEAELALAKSPKEELATLNRLVERAKQTEKKVRFLFEAGEGGGQRKDYESAKRDRLTAEIMLLQARIRQIN
jgi:hypothetical protein